MENKGWGYLSTALGLVASMIFPVPKVLALPAALFFFLAFYEYSKVGLRWRSLALRFGTLATCAYMLYAGALLVLSPEPTIAVIVFALGVVLAVLLIFRKPEKPLDMTPKELMEQWWGAAGADDMVSRDHHIQKRFGGRLYRVTGTVAWTRTEDGDAVVQIQWQPNKQTMPVSFDLYCDSRRYQPLTDGTPVTAEGRIRSITTMLVLLDDAKFYT